MTSTPNFPTRRRFLESSLGSALAWRGLSVATAAGLAGTRGKVRGQDAPIGLISTDLKRLITREANPYNGEPAPDELVAQFLTPTRSLYIRSHGNVPHIDAGSFRLSVGGMVGRPATFTLDELRDRFPAVSTLAAMTCAGNRRSEFAQSGHSAPGVQWGIGAIGMADWQGVRLVDVLKACEVAGDARHVWFEGLDTITGHGDPFAFGASIPIEKALEDRVGEGTLLAWGMNGDPLLPEHGYPLRTVVPGYIGARSVKWLANIVVSDRPSPNYFVQDVYKVVLDEAPESTANAEPIMEYALNSAVADVRRVGTNLRLTGYALPQGSIGNAVERVEVRAGGSRSWTPATITTPTIPNAWALWNATLPAAGVERVTVRAADRAGNAQPESQPFNIKGYQFNSYHSRPVEDA